MNSILLVACAGTKLDCAAPAGDLYTSALFTKSRAYAEARGKPWFILSAKHGLISPLHIIEPYDETLNEKPIDERRAWSEAAFSLLEEMVGPGDRVEILAGARYRQFIEPALRALGVEVSVPLEGLGIGKQLQWLTRQLSGADDRRDHLRRFYTSLDDLRVRVGGWRQLDTASGKNDWPQRGVYFFFDEMERRSGRGDGHRCVRIGTHAVSAGSKATLWGRLRQHKGSHRLGGNHRGSIFRKLVGQSLIERGQLDAYPTWGEGSHATKSVREAEHEHEVDVSHYIRALPFVCLPIDDEPSRHSLRAYIERNSIALLSAVPQREVIDPASSDWLGAACPAPKVPASGLWNQKHVDEDYDPAFLEQLDRLVDGVIGV